MGPQKETNHNTPAESEPECPQKTPTLDPGDPSSPSPVTVGDHVKPGVELGGFSEEVNSNVKSSVTENGGTQAATSMNNDEFEKQHPSSSKSWYNGTWPRITKSSAVTQIWKDNVSVASTSMGESFQQGDSQDTSPRLSLKNTTPPRTSSRTPSLYLTRNLASSSRSLPLSATTAKISVSSSSTNPSVHEQDTEQQLSGPTPVKESHDTLGVPTSGPKSHRSPADELQKPSQKHPPRKPLNEAVEYQPFVADNRSIWPSWLMRSDVIREPVASIPACPEEDGKMKEPMRQASQQPRPDTVPKPLSACQNRTASEDSKSDTLGTQPNRSWLGLLRGSTQFSEDNPTTVKLGPESTSSERCEAIRNTQIVGVEKNATPAASSVPIKEPPATPRSWTFWPRRTTSAPKDEAHGTSPNKAPAINSTVTPQSFSRAKDETTLQSNSSYPTTENLPQPPELRNTQQASTITSAKSNSSAKAKVTISPDIGTSKVAGLPGNTKDLIIPSLKETYKYAESLGIFQKLGRLLNYRKYTTPEHVGILRDPPIIKKAIAIGVHGYFPAPLIRTVLGQPTGTSIKFAESAANAIAQWTQDHGYTCEIVKIALEGEGKISERIELLWKLMLNWTDAIREADFILLACHSQGVPVAVMLTEKLISLGFLNGARIGICAMAGINLGPFSDYKSRWISGSAGELFDFAERDSRVSKDYEIALKVILEYGARIVYIGSINDQLVSLEVTFSHLLKTRKH